jgi:hypothetical protein
MANEWIIERLGDRELKVTIPDSVEIKGDKEITLEDLVYSISIEIVRKFNDEHDLQSNQKQTDRS